MYDATDKNLFNRDNLQNEYLIRLADIGITIHPPWLPVYKYVSSATAKEIIKNNCFWFRPPIAFNDPFEFSLDFFDFTLSVEEYKEILFRSLRDSSYTDAQAIQIMLSTNRYKYASAYLEMIDDERKKSLLFCGSANNSNTLMWSHYGDCHRGVCMGFLMPTVGAEELLVTLKVNYASEIIPQKLFAKTEIEKDQAKYYWIYTKAKDWYYEEEVRTYLNNTDGGFKLKQDSFGSPYLDVRFPKERLVEIYYGLNTPMPEVEEIKRLLSENEYQIKKSGRMRFNKGSFGLQIEME